MFKAIYDIFSPFRLVEDTRLGIAPLLVAGALAAGSLLKNRAGNAASKDRADLYNQYRDDYMGASQDVLDRLQAAGQDPFSGLTSGQSSTNWGSMTGAGSGTSASDTRQQQRYVAYSPSDKLLLSLLEANVGRPSVAQSGELQRALGRTNRAFEGIEAAERNAAARRGQPSGVNYADRQRIAALQGEFGQQMDREQERRRFDQNALNQALIQRAGQDTNSQMRARYNNQTSQNTMGGFNNQFQAAPDMAMLHQLLAPPSPEASGKTGRSYLGDALNSGVQGYMMGQGMPMGSGGGGSPMQMPFGAGSPIDPNVIRYYGGGR